MRKLTSSLAMLVVLGWAASAQAGAVVIYWNLSGSSGSVKTGGFTIPSYSVMGTLDITFYDPSSSPASTVTAPIPHGKVHLRTFKVTGVGGLNVGLWDITGTVKAALTAGSCTSNFSHGANSKSRIPGSCNAKFAIYSKGHCSGFCGFAPGTWPGGASSTQTQTFTATIHLPTLYYSHTTMSMKYLASAQVTVVPPGSHLAASNAGYHTFHVVGKETKRTHP